MNRVGRAVGALNESYFAGNIRNARFFELARRAGLQKGGFDGRNFELFSRRIQRIIAAIAVFLQDFSIFGIGHRRQITGNKQLIRGAFTFKIGVAELVAVALIRAVQAAGSFGAAHFVVGKNEIAYISLIDRIGNGQHIGFVNFLLYQSLNCLVKLGQVFSGRRKPCAFDDVDHFGHGLRESFGRRNCPRNIVCRIRVAPVIAVNRFD